MNNFRIIEEKKIALIAHDNKKLDLVNWTYRNMKLLRNHTLCGTEDTAILVDEKVGLDIKRYENGVMGGDQQIGRCIVNGEIDLIIYFWDPLTTHAHDSDMKALLRIAMVYNIPIAMNESSADCILNSNFIN